MHTVSDYEVPSPIGTSKHNPIPKAPGTSGKREWKVYEPGSREMAQQFRADAALPEQPSWFLTQTHQETHNLILSWLGFCQPDKSLGHLRRGNYN